MPVISSIRVLDPWALRDAPRPAAPAPPSSPADSVFVADGPKEAEPTRSPATRIALAGLLGLTVASGLAGCANPMLPATAATLSATPTRHANRRPTDSALRQVARARSPWATLPTLGDAVRTTAPATTVAQTRAALEGLQYPALDPFVASVAATVWSGQHGAEAAEPVEVRVPGHLGGALSVELNLKNGPGAPMLVILPGIGADATASHVGALRRMALDRGMNYVVVPNAWSMEWQHAHPAHNPGILPEEAAATYDVLDALRSQNPGYFGKVSMVGYSYGAILGANLLQYQADRAPVVNGSLVAISPPVNLTSSMARLDHLRQEYHDALDWMDVGAKYGEAVSQFGFDRFSASPLANRPNADVERFLADTIGSRNGLREVVGFVDSYRGVNALPLNHEVALHGPIQDAERREDLSQEQDWALDDVTYGSYSDSYLARDPWFAEHGTTPTALAETYRYDRLLDRVSGHGVPILTISSADDYILQPADVEALRALEAQPHTDQATHVLPHGGHVGAMFSPQARERVMDFLESPPQG